MRHRALLLAIAGLAVACAPRGEVKPSPDAPVVLISIDTLRSDHLPAYGYAKGATPAIDALRREGVLFERAYSHVPLTLPSHSSILTGMLPSQHGVRDNLGYRLDAAKLPYLPRLLHERGYATGGAISAFVLRAETGLAQGFDFYDGAIAQHPNEELGRSQRAGKETLAAVRPWLEQAAQRKLFLFFHTYEPHTPYEPAPAFAGRFADPYDGEVATADAVIGDLVADLKRLGVWDRAIVVLLSDHGEGLGDHGEAEHGFLLYREALQVPLIVKLPGGARAGTSVAAPVELADVAPTILDLVGIAPPREMVGQPLFRGELAANRPIYAETFFPRLHFGWSELASLLRGSAHYIHGPDPELYDLAADPTERKNQRASERRTAADLRQVLAGFERPLAAPSQEDPETARQLAALGYVGSAAVMGDDPLPDPKTRLGMLVEYGAAMQLVNSGHAGQALPMLEKLTEQNPRMIDVWASLAKALFATGRKTEALAAYQKAMQLSQGSGYIAVATGSVLLELGRLDEAAKHAELGLVASPAKARILLAQVALARHDLAAAEREARAAIEASSHQPNALLLHAQVLQAQGKLEEALAEVESVARDAAKQTTPPMGLNDARGDLFARLGRGDQAEPAFLAEIRAYPAEPRAYTHLAVLYASSGRPAEAVDVLRRLVEGNADSPGAYEAAVNTLRTLGDPAAARALHQVALQRFPKSPELKALK